MHASHHSGHNLKQFPEVRSHEHRLKGWWKRGEHICWVPPGGRWLGRLQWLLPATHWTVRPWVTSGSSSKVRVTTKGKCLEWIQAIMTEKPKTLARVASGAASASGKKCGISARKRRGAVWGGSWVSLHCNKTENYTLSRTWEVCQ